MSYNKKKLLEIYAKKLSTFATDKDICIALNCGEDKIIKYSDLINYDCFCKLLPNTEFDFKVILIEMKENVGHWTCVVRHKNNIFLFDPYGCSIDKELSFIDQAQRVLLGEEKQLINRLIRLCDCSVNIYENDNKFQSLKEGVSCCGRWVILFIEMCKMGYTIDEFSKFVYTASENEGKPTDILVVNWIPIGSDIK